MNENYKENDKGLPYADWSDFTDSTWECIRDDYEAHNCSIQDVADKWNIPAPILKCRIKNNKWLTTTKARQLEEHLENNPLECKKLSSHRNKAHQELTPAEKLVVKKAKSTIDYQSDILDITLNALAELKADGGLKIKSAFDLEKIDAVARRTLNLDDDQSKDQIIDTNFTSAKHKPVIIDVD
jgi:hypothetical protein